MALIEQLSPGRTPVVIPEVDELAARRTLREQIARLERELVTRLPGACPRLPPARRVALAPARGCSRWASSSACATSWPVASRACAPRRRQAAAPGRARALLERMLPTRPPQVGAGLQRRARRARLQALARPPAAGPVGMLAGWWHVKVSSGCPLAWGP